MTQNAQENHAWNDHVLRHTYAMNLMRLSLFTTNPTAEKNWKKSKLDILFEAMTLEAASSAKSIYGYIHNTVEDYHLSNIKSNTLKAMDLLIKYHKERILQFQEDYKSLLFEKDIAGYLEDIRYVKSLEHTEFDTGRFIEDFEFMSETIDKLRDIDIRLNTHRPHLDKQIREKRWYWFRFFIDKVISKFRYNLL